MAIANNNEFELKEEKNIDDNNNNQRQPAIFINHGGGPLPYLQLISKKRNNAPDQEAIIKACKILGNEIIKNKPTAILVISAHWEKLNPTLMYSNEPSLLYDYYGFPSEAYNLEFKTKCDINISNKLIKLLNKNGFKNVKKDIKRGWDHGVFVPFLCSNIKSTDLPPLLQLSLLNNLNSELHIILGTILSNLRNKHNIMIVGSGMLFHNMSLRGMDADDEVLKKSIKFTEWMNENVANKNNSKDLKSRFDSIIRWDNDKLENNFGRYCHPREEHLLPLYVCFGSSFTPEEYDIIMKPDINKTEDDTTLIKEIDKKNSNVNIIEGDVFGVRVANYIFN